MTDQQPLFRPVGVRPAGPRTAPIRWVDPGDLLVAVGNRIVVREDDREWLAEVVVAADRLVEVAPLGDVPRSVRDADPDDWPTEPARAGLALLRSLDLPD